MATPLADPNLTFAESILSKLEFGDKVVSPQARLRLRKNIVSHGLSSWDVRQAFNSLALKRQGSVLLLRRQPLWLYRFCTFLMWAFVSAFVVLFGTAIIQVMQPSLGQQSLDYLFYGLNLCVVFTAMLYTLGQHWKLGQEVLDKLIEPG